LYGHVGERITALNFNFLVGRDILSQEHIESTTEFDALQRAIALLEGALRLYEDFPRLKVLGYFEFEHELLAAFPDGSNLGGGFWVGDEYEGKYYFWDRKRNQWQGIDPNRGRTGDHFIPIDEPKTAQELHTMGIRVGDSIVITAEPNTSDIGIVVAGRMRYAGAVIRRIGATPVDSSFIEMKSIRGLIGPPGEHNPRGNWSADVTDYKRFDTVVFEGGTYNTYMYYSRTPNLQDSPEFAGQEGNPWMIWGARGADGEAATIEISETKTIPSDQPARLEPIGTPTHGNYIAHIPHGKAASIRFRNTFSVEDAADVKTIPVGKEETETEVIFIFDIYIQRGEKGEAQGTMNHAELDNLDIESSGHTGFASEATLQELQDSISGRLIPVVLREIANADGYVITAISQTPIPTHAVVGDYLIITGPTPFNMPNTTQTSQVGEIREVIAGASTVLQCPFRARALPPSVGISAGRNSLRIHVNTGSTAPAADSIAIGDVSVAGRWSLGLGRVGSVGGHHSVGIGKNIHVPHAMSLLLAPGGGSITGETIPIAQQVWSRAENSLDLGRSGVQVSSYSAISTISDERDKVIIGEIDGEKAYKFLMAIEPIQYKTNLRSDYFFHKEITEDEFNSLDEYDRIYNVISMPVYALEVDGNILPFEWITEMHSIGGVAIEYDPNYIKNRDSRFKDPESRKAVMLGDIPEIYHINDTRCAEIFPSHRGHEPVFISAYLHDYYEAVATWRLSLYGSRLTRAQAEFPCFNPSPDGQPDPNDLNKYDPNQIQVREARFLRCYHDSKTEEFAGKRPHNGFSAQQVEVAAIETGFGDFAGIKHLSHNKDENGIPLGDDQYQLSHDELHGVYVAAFKHQTKIISKLIGRIEMLERNGR